MVQGVQLEPKGRQVDVPPTVEQILGLVIGRSSRCRAGKAGGTQIRIGFLFATWLTLWAAAAGSTFAQRCPTSSTVRVAIG